MQPPRITGNTSSPFLVRRAKRRVRAAPRGHAGGGRALPAHRYTALFQPSWAFVSSAAAAGSPRQPAGTRSPLPAGAARRSTSPSPPPLSRAPRRPRARRRRGRAQGGAGGGAGRAHAQRCAIPGIKGRPGGAGEALGGGRRRKESNQRRDVALDFLSLYHPPSFPSRRRHGEDRGQPGELDGRGGHVFGREGRAARRASLAGGRAGRERCPGQLGRRGTLLGPPGAPERPWPAGDGGCEPVCCRAGGARSAMRRERGSRAAGSVGPQGGNK